MFYFCRTQVVQRASKPMPTWGPAADKNRKGRYALRPDDMLPVYPSIIQLSADKTKSNGFSNTGFTEDKTNFSGFTNSGFIGDNDFPDPPSPISNGFSSGLNKGKDDDASSSSSSNSGDGKD